MEGRFETRWGLPLLCREIFDPCRKVLKMATRSSNIDLVLVRHPEPEPGHSPSSPKDSGEKTLSEQALVVAAGYEGNTDSA